MAQQAAGEPSHYTGAALFFGFALLTTLSAGAIVVSSNIVRMAVYLLMTLGGVAGLYFFMDAELLGAIQLIVYVGGTLILIVFGLMLTSRLGPQLAPRRWEAVAGLGLGLTMLAVLLTAVARTPLGPTLPAAPASYEQVQAVGRGLLTTYLVPFEVAGVLLLVVMIGAAYMARKKG